MEIEAGKCSANLKTSRVMADNVLSPLGKNGQCIISHRSQTDLVQKIIFWSVSLTKKQGGMCCDQTWHIVVLAMKIGTAGL